jgi:hypothetical protein
MRPLCVDSLHTGVGMALQRFVRNENIARYRKLIAITEGDPFRDEVRHQTLLKLLAEEMGKDMEQQTGSRLPDA